MGFILFMFVLLILLLLLVTIGSVQQASIFIVSGKKIEFVNMLLPSLLSILSFTFILFVANFILNKLKINAFDFIYYNIMNWEYTFNNTLLVFITIFVSFIVFILLQAYILKLVTLDYKKIWEKTYKFFITKVFKKTIKKTLTASSDEISNNEHSEPSEKEKVSIDLSKIIPSENQNINNEKQLLFFHILSASLFSFSLVFFAILFFMFIGIRFGNKFIA
ncbi:MAG: hypothetical protein PHR25_01385 [Clostridia bacterium]|nr:hypothetical protein [Clostridia bacterium]MDD4375420.1 hypothetical protein [Clostridia bacterium]